MNEQQRPQDPMVRTRSTTKKKNSKGGDWLLLYVDQDQVQFMIEALQACAANPRGARLDLHTNQKQADNGRTFDSTIVYVKPCQEQQQQQAGGFGNQPRQYAPRGAQTPDTRNRVQQAYGAQRPPAPTAPPARQYAPRQAPQPQPQPPVEDTGFAGTPPGDEEVPF